VITIMLKEVSRQCLLDVVTRGSRAYMALIAATRLPGSVRPSDHVVMIQCERDVATALLVLATHSCHGAASSIGRALVEARGRSSPSRSAPPPSPPSPPG
jgi:hypothetical protein